MKRLLTISLAAAAALLCCTVAAHDMPSERKLVVDVGVSSVEMMLVYQKPKSDPVTLLFQKYDLNGDGELTGGEAQLAGREWMPRMLHGLQFEVAGERPRGQEPEIKFRREDDGALSAAAYLKWELDTLAPDASRTFHVRVLDRDSATKTLVELRAADGMSAERAAKTMLPPGGQATIEARRSPADE